MFNKLFVMFMLCCSNSFCQENLLNSVKSDSDIINLLIKLDTINVKDFDSIRKYELYFDYYQSIGIPYNGGDDWILYDFDNDNEQELFVKYVDHLDQPYQVILDVQKQILNKTVLNTDHDFDIRWDQRRKELDIYEVSGSEYPDRFLYPITLSAASTAATLSS